MLAAVPLAIALALFAPAQATPMWSPNSGTAAGTMQSSAVGPTSGPLQKLYTITNPNPQQPDRPATAQLVGITSSGLAVVLSLSGVYYQQNPTLNVFRNALALWDNPTTLQQCSPSCSYIGVTFDDELIYVSTTFGQQQQQQQFGVTVLNITSGAVMTSSYALPFPAPVTVFVNAADAPGGSLVWVTSNFTALAGTFNTTTIKFDGVSSKLAVNAGNCSLGHGAFAVCDIVTSPFGMAVLRAGGPGSGPTLAWDDFVLPVFIASDIGPNGALIVDTDYGGFTGGTWVACDLATGAAFWTLVKPTNETITAFAYDGAGTLVLKSFFDDGATFSVKFTTLNLTQSGFSVASTASAPSFPPEPPAGQPFVDYLTLDSTGKVAYTLDSDGGAWNFQAVQVGVSGPGAISVLLSDPSLSPAPLIAGPKSTQITVQEDNCTIAVYM